MINDEKLTANALTDEELEQVTGGLTNNPYYYGCNSGGFMANNSAYTGNPICVLCRHYRNGACANGYDNLVQGVSSGGGM